MSMQDSERRAIRTATIALLLLAVVFVCVCGLGLLKGSISLGRPFAVTYGIAQSPLLFWLVWSFWAALALLAAGAAGWLHRQGRR